jgi:hypothetical protein
MPATAFPALPGGVPSSERTADGGAPLRSW